MHSPGDRRGSGTGQPRRLALAALRALGVLGVTAVLDPMGCVGAGPIAPRPAIAQGTVGQDVSTPPPVSGRRLSDPASILPADVLARVELVRANVALIRKFMGRPEPPSPFLRVESAQPREVYSQALNLQQRANRLAFEQVRVVRSESVPLQQDARPADVFAVVDTALAAALLVKQELGIDDTIGEQARPESTTPSEVFNAIVATGGDLNNILAKKTSPSDVFQLVTGSVHQAASLHAALPGGGYLPKEPAFEPNKTPGDVYARMQRCFVLIQRLAAANGIRTLTFEFDENYHPQVTPNDVSDLAALVLEELLHLHREFPEAKAPARAYHPGKRFPAHVYQRAGLLEALLTDLVAAGAAKPSARSDSD
ncbi:MAG: hypothetical protein E4H03_03510 [Myxococcales bacterium]|nr:MAG: hypothetical protein E4H03_03510 [Myxococcales bacterium]